MQPDEPGPQNGRQLRGHATPPDDHRNGHSDGLALHLPLDKRAPASARTLVLCYRDRVAGVLLEDAQLVLSELVTNSLRHSGAAPDEGLVVRTRLTDTALRVEVENPGQRGVVALRAPGGSRGGGYGLNIVEHVSRRWGVERTRDVGTRVWADLARTA